MKRLGDVLKDIHIPIPPAGANGTPPVPKVRVRCHICQDAGYLRRDLPVGHPSFGRIIKCECKLQEENEQAAEDFRRISNLDAFMGKTFDTFDRTVAGVEDAFEEAKHFTHSTEGWLFLQGPCGSGKTHLAVAVALDVMARRPNQRVIFAVVPDLLDHLRNTFSPDSAVAYDDRFDEIKNAHLLVLDDLGTENTTPWAREKLFQIINHRYNERWLTVITSNQDIHDLDPRVRSRIVDKNLTRWITMDTEDFRSPPGVNLQRSTTSGSTRRRKYNG